MHPRSNAAVRFWDAASTGSQICTDWVTRDFEEAEQEFATVNPRQPLEARPSDAGIPSIACVCRRGAQPLTEALQIVADRQVVDEFHVLVADLARDAQAKWPAMAHGKLVAIHPVGQ